jgi:hypothetical protein
MLFKAYKPLSKLQQTLMDPKTSVELWRKSLQSLAAELKKISMDQSASSSPLPTAPTIAMSSGIRDEIYLMIQLAIQSGPLRGSDPGYFKRASTTPDHIEPAVEFLKQIDPFLAALGLSQNQCERVMKWRADGETQLQKKLDKLNKSKQ